jgi:hypothetical protein
MAVVGVPLGALILFLAWLYQFEFGGAVTGFYAAGWVLVAVGMLSAVRSWCLRRQEYR